MYMYMYNGIKEAIGPAPKKSAPLLSASGEILTDPPAQLDRWAEHYALSMLATL